MEEGDPWDGVVFSIWHGRELLVSDFMPVEEFVDRLLSVDHIQEQLK
jgi:hypothetical protein